MKNNSITKKVLKALREALKCYAGRMHLTRGGNKGYALVFEKVAEFPGRMEAIAKTSDLTGKARLDKPWMSGASRIIFVSDMGDALSKGVSFEYLRKEIIDPVTSPEGSNHIWTWLTKRPARMAAFSRWLMAQGIQWPDNLIAMTSVTSKRTCGRIDALKTVAAPHKGLSVEPLWESIDVDLTGIDWCIVGGESGPSAKAFDLAWARHLRDLCLASRTAFFVKQLGAVPVDGGCPLLLQDSHGGDWNEWPDDLKIRSFPDRFYFGNSRIPILPTVTNCSSTKHLMVK